MKPQPLPPMMGWSSWNLFRQNISEALMREMGRAMAETGLLAAGYRYLNLDDCWQASQRDPAGRLQFDPGLFPSGPGMVQDMRALGLRVGLYSSAGPLTCEDMPGSEGREGMDAHTFAAWGISFLKYDYCHVVDLPTDPHHQPDSFPTRTPPIQYLGVAGGPEEEAERRYPAEEAALSGAARLEGDGIHGLCCARGSATFTVRAPAAGVYALSLGYHKAYAPYPGYVEARLPSGKSAEVWFQRSSGWSGTGRASAALRLAAGDNAITLHNPIRGQREDSIRRYARMGRALQGATAGGEAISLAVCEHGRAEPWTWAGELAASWRVGPDIRPAWDSIVACYERAAALWAYQRPGAYNDPDMLEIGVAPLTQAEAIAHFTLWCMLSAPLVLGCDARRFYGRATDPEAAFWYRVITHAPVIALHQDAALLQAKPVLAERGIEVLVKPLAGGEAAVCFFNKAGGEGGSLRLPVDTLLALDGRVFMPRAAAYGLHNLWTDAKTTGVTLDSGPLPAHGVSVFRVGR